MSASARRVRGVRHHSDTPTAAELASAGPVELLGPDGRLLGRFVPIPQPKLSDREAIERMNRLRQIDEPG